MNKQKQISYQSTSDKLVQLILSGGYKLFRDQLNEAYIVNPQEPLIARRIHSMETKTMLMKIYWAQFEKTMLPNILESAVMTLEGIAQFNEETQEIHTRVVKIGNTIYYDLGDNKHVVTITPDGWTVNTEAPVFFRRYRHQMPQAMPLQGGDIKHFKNYIHISSKTHEILLISYLAVALVADIDRPLLLMHGPQGSGKSTALEFVRSLIDPSRLPLLQPPKDVNEMVQQANKHYAYFLDNVSYVKNDTSDTLCRFVTGNAFSKRVLYSDDDDFLYEFKRVTGFTSIAQVANNSDLLDRSLIIRLELITQENRISDELLNTEFIKEKPYLMGSLFDITSGMLRKIDSVQFKKLPRMADYYRYAAAASDALGYTISGFTKAFATNIQYQNQESIDSSPVIQSILIFMKDNNFYRDTPTRLYVRLRDIAQRFDIDDNFPKGSSWLWKKIQQSKATLASIGIEVKRNRETGSRFITITKNAAYTTLIDESVPSSCEADQKVFTDALHQNPVTV